MAITDFWQKVCERISTEAWRRLGWDNKPEYQPFRKFYFWWGTKLTPFIMNIASFFVLYFIFNTVYTKYGMDRLIIIIATLFVLNLQFGGKSA